MSTVANLLSNVQPRIGSPPSLYWAINHAIRTVAKRLFILESDIIKSSMVLEFGVEEDSKLITSTYSDFWGLAGRPYLNGEKDPLEPAKSNDHLAYKPEVHDSNQGSLSYSSNEFTDDGQDFSDYTEGNYIYKLVVTNDDSTESWGYIGGTDGDTTAQVYQDRSCDTAGWNGTDPSGKTPSSYEVQTQAIGKPRLFELKGNTLHIYPCDEDEWIVYGDYFAKPTELTSTTDTIPFKELFDDVIEEHVVKIFRSGFTGNDKKSDFRLLQDFTWKAVDEIVSLRGQTQIGGWGA